MKTTLLILLMVCCAPVWAQWTPHVVTNMATNSQKIVVGYIDSDGDVDVVSMNQGTDLVEWYPNTAGNGTFTTTITVGFLEEGRDIALGDLDGDGDIDVVGVSAELTISPNPQMVWFENLDGEGNFAAPKVIPTPNTESGGSVNVALAYVNSDSDLDIVVTIGTNGGDGTVTWYENLDGNGTFNDGTVLIQNRADGSSLDVKDINGDGDVEIVSGNASGGAVDLFINQNGEGGFAAPITFGTSNLGVFYLHAVDMDGDNDVDVLGSCSANDLIAWWENLNGQYNFSTERVIIDDKDNPNDVFPVDLDNDNDMDVLAVFALTGELVWFENLDGQGSFGAPQFIFNDLPFAITVTAADLDGDGDMDPVAASQTSGFIYWFENDLLGVEELEMAQIQLYPNPVSEILHIQSRDPLQQVTFYDVLGQSLMTVYKDFENIPVSNLPAGVYFVEVQTLKGVLVKRVVKE